MTDADTFSSGSWDESDHPTREVDVAEVDVAEVDARSTDPRIAEAVARLDSLAETEPAEHVEVYEQVHRVLQDALADATDATGGADGGDGPERPGGSRP